jgi:hypothetical protein
MRSNRVIVERTAEKGLLATRHRRTSDTPRVVIEITGVCVNRHDAVRMCGRNMAGADLILPSLSVGAIQKLHADSEERRGVHSEA